MKKNLVIIPSGNFAQFEQWSDLSQYNFDLGIIVWSDNKLKNIENAKYIEYLQGQKWHIISKFAEKNPVDSYEYIWILDDDCQVDPATIDKIFEFCKENNLDLAQPALTANSFASHQPTFQIPGAKMHITDTVEIMCPIFSQRVWQDCSRHFGKMPVGIGYGMEGYWRTVLESANGTTRYGGLVAVIDSYPVHHSKSVTNAHDYAQKNIDPNQDGFYFQHLGYLWKFNTLNIVY